MGIDYSRPQRSEGTPEPASPSPTPPSPAPMTEPPTSQGFTTPMGRDLSALPEIPSFPAPAVGPTPEPQSVTANDFSHAAAAPTINKAKSLLNQLGLSYVDLEPGLLGLGVGVAFGDTDYCVLSTVGGGDNHDSQLTISCGVLRDIRRDRFLALHGVNRITQNRPAYPFYLHDADLGWDIVLSVAAPVQLYLDAPAYLNMLVRGLPGIAEEGRAQLAELNLGGTPYRWARADQQRLLMRAMI